MLYNRSSYNTATYNNQLDRLFVRSIVTYVEKLITDISRSVSLSRQITTYVKQIMTSLERTNNLSRQITTYTGKIITTVIRTVSLNRLVTTYVKKIVTLVESIPILVGFDVGGLVKKRGSLTGRLRRWD